jgi:hypothetical protein
LFADRHTCDLLAASTVEALFSERSCAVFRCRLCFSFRLSLSLRLILHLSLLLDEIQGVYELLVLRCSLLRQDVL